MSEHDQGKERGYLPRAWGGGRVKKPRLPEIAVEPLPAEPAEDQAPEQHIEASEKTACPNCQEMAAAADSVSTNAEICASDHPCRSAVLNLEESERDRSAGVHESGPVRLRAIIAGVRFGYAGKIYHFEAGEMELARGDWVMVKTDKGIGLGQVAVAPVECELNAGQLDGLRQILRKAGRSDLDQRSRCAQRETEAYQYCLERIGELGLPMKLIAVESFFDASKYVFYFTSEGRVDFRELVKQLVARFPVRIEMRQIGVRHAAKMTGGIASCGQELCCSRYLSDFRPVSVRMAKTQNLSLNPTKISGGCGRLMCCLAYEHETYEEFKRGLPKIGKEVKIPQGAGVILKYNPLTDSVSVMLKDETVVEVPRNEIMYDAAAVSQKNDIEDECPEDFSESLDDEPLPDTF